jgi:hypothetical protein
MASGLADLPSCCLIWPDATGNPNNPWVSRHLQIQSRSDHPLKAGQIPVLNVPTIFPKMTDDGITAGLLSNRCCPQGTGGLSRSGLAKGRHMVHIDSQSRHRGLQKEGLANRNPGPNG